MSIALQINLETGFKMHHYERTQVHIYKGGNTITLDNISTEERIPYQNRIR